MMYNDVYYFTISLHKHYIKNGAKTKGTRFNKVRISVDVIKIVIIKIGLDSFRLHEIKPPFINVKKTQLDNSFNCN